MSQLQAAVQYKQQAADVLQSKVPE